MGVQELIESCSSPFTTPWGMRGMGQCRIHPNAGPPHLNYNWRRKPSNVTSFRGCHLRTSTSVLRSRTAKGYDTVGAKLNRTRECHDLAQCYVPMRKRTHAQVWTAWISAEACLHQHMETCSAVLRSWYLFDISDQHAIVAGFENDFYLIKLSHHHHEFLFFFHSCCRFLLQWS